MGPKGLLGRRALIVLALTALVIATAVSATGPTVNQQVREANAPAWTRSHRNDNRNGPSQPGRPVRFSES